MALLELSRARRGAEGRELHTPDDVKVRRRPVSRIAVTASPEAEAMEAEALEICCRGSSMRWWYHDNSKCEMLSVSA